MKHDLLTAAALLSHAELLTRLQDLAAGARENTVEMVAHLAELEARRSYLQEGYGSLFDYCRLALRLSEHSAYNRVAATRVVRQFPAILARLEDGSLNLTTVRLVAPHLTSDNHREVLARAAGCSKRETEALVASLAPQPDVASSVRRLLVVRGGTPDDQPPAGSEEAKDTRTGGTAVVATPVALADTHVVVAGAQITSPSARPIVAPLSPGRYRVQFTVDSEGYENLRLLQDLLRREIPDGDPGVICARALKLLAAEVAKEKTAAVPTPRSVPAPAPGSRHIAAAVKRAVWLRDRGQCAYVGRHGRRCVQRVFLEFHHIQPYAVGGEGTIDNISLRCRRHNEHEATLAFGPDVARSAGDLPGRRGLVPRVE